MSQQYFDLAHRRRAIAAVTGAVISVVVSAIASADEPVVRFDVPALIAAYEVNHAPTWSSAEKSIEVVVPVSTEIRPNDRKNIHEFRFDISWNRDVYPIVDYGPKTQTVSAIQGLISIDQSNDQNTGFGFSADGSAEVVNADLSFNAKKSSEHHESYKRLPQHEVLVASGTVERGTGAFFRFHPSTQETLEGGRDLVVVFRVPANWRSGLLQVQCRAVGSRRVAGLWSEPVRPGRSFVVPLYLATDESARLSASEFVRAEQQLRRSWLESGEQRLGKTTQGWPQVSFASPFAKSQPPLPEDWPHLLIQSGNDAWLDQYQARLPQDVAVKAGQFVQARRSLLRLEN